MFLIKTTVQFALAIIHNFVVPQIHVKRKLVIDAFYTECRHIADYALQRSRDAHACHQQVRVFALRLTWLFVAVVVAPTLYPSQLAAFVGIWS